MSEHKFYLHVRETSWGIGSIPHTEVEFRGIYREILANFFIPYVVTEEVHSLDRVFLVVPRYNQTIGALPRTGLWTVWAIVGSEESAKTIASDLIAEKVQRWVPWTSLYELDRIEIHSMPVGSPRDRKITVTHHE